MPLEPIDLYSYVEFHFGDQYFLTFLSIRKPCSISIVYLFLSDSLLDHAFQFLLAAAQGESISASNEVIDIEAAPMQPVFLLARFVRGGHIYPESNCFFPSFVPVTPA